MKKIITLAKTLLNKEARFDYFTQKGFYNNYPDETFLKKSFKIHLGYELNLKNPQTFNEKLQWLKLYNRKDLYTTLVDKYSVKQYVADKIGEEYIIPTLGVWNSFEEINFDTLPNQFVLKCTHDSGGLVICKDKKSLDICDANRKLSYFLKRNYYLMGREWPYKNVVPRIIAEKYMEDPQYKELRDYKFYTFNGEPKFLLLATNRQSKQKPLSFDYYDMDFNHLPLTNHWHPNNIDGIPEKPQKFEKMKELASVLAKGFPHARIDFYEVCDKIYFGEITLFDMSGFLKIHPDSWDLEWGKLIELPKQ